MTFFRDIQTETQLKKQYRRLAVIYHPDKGGNPEIMQHINYEYEIVRKAFQKPPRTLRDLQEGDTCYVNGTPCTVLYVLKNSFLVKAKHKERTAWFNSMSGYCKINRKFKATVDPIFYKN